MRGDACAVEPVWMVGDYDLIGILAGDELAFQRNAVVGGEIDVFVRETSFGGVVHYRGQGPTSEVVYDGLEN